jgi:CheY-like chemotaxis protein
MTVLDARSVTGWLLSWWRAADSSSPLQRTVRIASAIGLGLALLILLGWACDISLLKSGLPGQSATQPLAAVCFALCAVALGLTTDAHPAARVAGRALALLVLVIVGATIWQNALDEDWGLDRWLFSDAVLHEQPGPFLRAGRCSAGVLIGLTLLSGCLLLSGVASRVGALLYAWFATAGALLALATIMAYALDVTALYALGFYSQVGLNSGLVLAVLFIGVLLRRPEVGWVPLLTRRTSGAVTGRRMLGASVVSLVVVSIWIRLATLGAAQGAGSALLLVALGGPGVLLAALLGYARRLESRERLESAHRVYPDMPVGEPANADAMIVPPPASANREGAILPVPASANPEPTVVPPAESSNERQQTLDTMRMKIIVADDHVDGAATLAAWLEIDGHEVWVANDGVEAVELAEHVRPDVIFMDISMPRMDGVEATRRIRATPWGRHIRIVALSAWGQESQRRRTGEAGVDFHLVKPVDPGALASMLAPVEPRH